MYDEVGGFPVLEKLVEDFYHIMATDPEAHECHATHAGKDVRESAEKLKFFLSGWLGGPQLYLEKYGHPRLRMRHFPFSIGEAEEAQWLYCMEKALSLSTIPQPMQKDMMEAFERVAHMVRNQE